MRFPSPLAFSEISVVRNEKKGEPTENDTHFGTENKRLKYVKTG